MGFQLSEFKLIGLSLQRSMLLSRVKMRGLRSLPTDVKKSIFYGEVYYCPVCDSHIRRFESFGYMDKAWCPVCAAMRWQRLAWLVLQQHTNLFQGTPTRMLHMAPEIAFEPRLRQLAHLDYVTADLYEPNVMVKMDVTENPFPDDAFDAIFCSHVMEHIPDDKRALSEFFRVLSPDGWAIFMVPIRMDKLTDEDLSITNPKERERRFGQHDHVRLYGKDFEDRLNAAGFQVTLFGPKDVVDVSQPENMGLHEKEVLFYCRKTK